MEGQGCETVNTLNFSEIYKNYCGKHCNWNKTKNGCKTVFLDEVKMITTELTMEI